MASRKLNPGLALSYVHRVDGCVRVHLELPQFGVPADGIRVKLVGADRSVVADETVVDTLTTRGVWLHATMPPGSVTNGFWEVKVSPAVGTTFRTTESRVLVADPQPISLLIGPATRSAVPPVRHTLPASQRVSHSAGLVADKALRELAPEKATRIRSGLRRAARRVSKVLPG